MKRSKTEFFFHFVWSTTQRKHILIGEIERRVHRCIRGEAEQLGCVVLAVNGMPDHVHCVLQLPATVSCAHLMQQIKGVSSTMARRELGELLGEYENFKWQKNYAGFSLSRSHLDRVIRYVNNQKQHHQNNSLWPEWEETEEDTPEPNS